MQAKGIRKYKKKKSYYQEVMVPNKKQTEIKCYIDYIVEHTTGESI